MICFMYDYVQGEKWQLSTLAHSSYSGISSGPSVRWRPGRLFERRILKQEEEESCVDANGEGKQVELVLHPTPIFVHVQDAHHRWQCRNRDDATPQRTNRWHEGVWHALWCYQSLAATHDNGWRRLDQRSRVDRCECVEKCLYGAGDGHLHGIA